MEIQPESAGFASELRGDLSRDLAAATAGLDKTIRIRVTTDADVAEAQIRRALTAVQEAVNRIFEQTRAKARQLYTFLEQRVVIRIANKIREWTQKTIARLKLLMEPFWKYLRTKLQQVQNGWRAFREFVTDAADRVAQRWRQALAVLSAQLARVREVGRRVFQGIADAAAPHLARLRRGVEALQRPFQVVRAYAVGAWRVVGDAGERAFRRLRSAAEPALGAVREGFDRSTTAARRWGSQLSGVFRRGVDGLGRFRDGFRSAEAAASRFSGRLGTLGGVTRRVFTAMRRDVQNLGRVISVTSSGIGRFGSGVQRLGDRVSGTSKISRIFGGVLKVVGSGISAVSTVTKAFGSVLSGAQTFTEAFSGVMKNLGGNFKDAASAAGQVLASVLQLGAQMAIYAVIAGAVTYAVGALGAAFAGLPALIGAAAASFAVFKLGMEGIKRAYESSLKPAIDALKTQIESVFERTLAPAFQRLSTQLIPQVTDSMKGLAQAFADGGVQIIDMVNRSDNIKKIQDLVNNTANEVRGQLVPALQNVIQAFIDIGANSAIMRDIVGIFTDLTNKTADWLDEMNRTGQAERSLSNLRSVLGKLEDLFFRLLTAAMQFFDAATPGMESLLDSIQPTEGVMRALGEAFGNAATAAGNLIRAIPPETWQRIADAVKELSEKLVELSENRAVQLFFQGLLESIPLVIDAFNTLADTVGKLSGPLGAVKDAFGAFTGGMDLGRAAAEAFGAEVPPPVEDAADRAAGAADRGGQGVRDGFIPPLEGIPGTASSLLAPLPPAVGDPVDEAARRAKEGADKAAADAAAGFQPIPPDAAATFAQLPPTVQAAMGQAQSAADTGAKQVQDAVTRGFDGAAQAASAAMPRVSDAVRAAMDAAASAAEGGGSRIREAVANAANQAADAAQSGMGRLSEAVRTGMDQAAAAAEAGGQRIADGLRSSIDAAVSSIETGMQRVSTAVEQGMARAQTAAQDGGRQIEQALRTSLDNVVRITEQSWQRITQAFQQGGQRAVQIARSTGQQIVATFQSLSGPMYSAGYQLISRLADGMIAAQGRAFAAAASTAAGIRARFPSSPAKEGPLSGAGDPLRSGGTIIERLAAGMTANAAAVTAALAPILAGLVARVNAVAADPMVDAAREILARIQARGQMFEDLTWRGASSNVGRYNDDLLDLQDRSGIRDTRAFLEDFIRRNTAPAPAAGGGDVVAVLQQILGTLVAMRGDAVANGYGPDLLAKLDELIGVLATRSGSATQRAASARDLSDLGAFP